MIIVLVPIFIGQYFGIYRSKKKPEELQRESVGTAVGAAFALLAFMLALTFQIATDRYNTRKELLLTEVTNIRTAYLRAGLLPDPIRSDSKKLLAEYVDIRVDFANDATKVHTLISRSQEILNILWGYTEMLAEYYIGCSFGCFHLESFRYSCVAHIQFCERRTGGGFDGKYRAIKSICTNGCRCGFLFWCLSARKQDNS